MHIVITDSGVGGLSVVAYAERFVRTQGFAEPVRLTFANAAPANDYGYNAMPSRAAKIETFDRFLRSVTQRFAPDAIYVACNTLSVLLPEVQAPVPIKGIIETGVALLLRALDDPRSVAMIFGTQTTIDSGVYPRALEERGIAAARIVSQACPGLADVISEDREGSKAKAEIERWIAAAMAKLPAAGAPVVACLACTHYGFRKEFFEEALPVVINPNESAVDDLCDRGGAVHDVEVRFVTRYVIPPATVDTLTWLLGDISPRTVAALQSFEHLPDLF
jgi:glutamate racemase